MNRSGHAILIRLLVVGLIGALAGCHHPVVGKPAIVGASASSGVGAQVVAPGATDQEQVIPVDLEAVFDGVILTSHGPPVVLARATHYADPLTSTREQLKEAQQVNPTCIIALDLLFWSAHGQVPTAEFGTAQERQDRRASLAATLALLEEIDVPLVLGLIPPIDAEQVEFLSVNQVPSPELRRQLNDDIRAWAQTRPNVVLVDLSDAMEDASAIGVDDGGVSIALLQADGIHPTAEGLIQLMQLTCAALEAQGLIEPADWQGDPQIVRAQLPEKAARANARKGGLSYLMLVFKGMKFDKALDKARDQRFDAVNYSNPKLADLSASAHCQEAAELLDEVLTALSQMPQGPGYWDEIDSNVTAMIEMAMNPNWGGACQEAIAEQMQRHLERLAPHVAVAVPDPWKLKLWLQAMDIVNQHNKTAPVLARVRDAMGGWKAPYEALALNYLFDEPANAAGIVVLLPETQGVDWLVGHKAARLSMGPPLPDSQMLLIPETDESLDGRRRAWRNQEKFYQSLNPGEARRLLASLGDQPERYIQWDPASESHLRFLEDMWVMVQTLGAQGESDVADQLLRAVIERVGPNMYRVYRLQLVERPDRPPLYQRRRSKVPPSLDELGITAPASERRQGAVRPGRPMPNVR